MTSHMFPKTALGPKEGRLPPGSFFSPVSAERRRRFGSRHKNALIFGIVILAFVFFSVYFHIKVLAHFGETHELSRDIPTLLNPENPILSGDTNKQGDELLRSNLRNSVRTSDPQKPIVDETTYRENLKEPTNKEPGRKEPTKKEPTTEKTGKQKVQYHTSKLVPEKQKPHPNRWPERPKFKDDLDALFALLPDEMNMREFLRPIENGGPERMREMGLRTRAYKKYLSAWEKLHLVEDKETGQTAIRDDVIQYLRGMENDEETSLGSSLTNTIHNYEAFRSFLAKFARVLFPFTNPYFADHMTLHAGFKNAGRGIVLTAGDDQAQYLMTTIHSFRELGCNLPIEVMYLGDDDLGEDHRFELEALPGVTTRDVSVMVDDEGWKLAGWAIKPFAMLLSSFREVIFIDADSFFFRDPAKLFDDPDYKKTGALFFRDRTIMPESKRRWLLQILPRPIHKLAKESSWWTGSSGHHQESGVVVVDKWKHFISMLLICRFNGSDRDARDGKMGVYEMMHGDKETFWIGFLLAGDSSFAFHKGAVGSIGVIETPSKTATARESSSSSSTPDATLDAPKEPEDDELPSSEIAAPASSKTYTICSPQLLHLDVDGTPLWFNGWLLTNKYTDRSRRRFAPMTSYLHEPRNKAVVDDDDFWKLAEDNLCCLTTGPESKFDLDEHDLGVLKMMRDRASEVGFMT
ncbi:glycosyltransferase family 71 protein [Xylaria castorea]|nr:glycosyltransferase family 71 protein [Xylaria castorea]